MPSATPRPNCSAGRQAKWWCWFVTPSGATDPATHAWARRTALPGAEALRHSWSASFVQLGMAQTTVLSSPVTRTAQTSHSMFGHEPAARTGWPRVAQPCATKSWRTNVAHHNLVLVTHSGCISDFEARPAFLTRQRAQYGSSLFLYALITHGTTSSAGHCECRDWNALLKQQQLEHLNN